MMLMSGIGLLAAAIPLPEARANPARPGITARCAAARCCRCLPFPGRVRRPERCGPRSGEVDGAELAGRRVPAGRGDIPRRSPKRVPRRQLQSRPPRHARIGDQYFSGKLRGNWRVPIGHTWEARIKLDCLYPGLWPSFWAVNEDPLPDGEVDIFEWYGNGNWPPGTTVHAASNGKTWEGKSIPGLVDGGWHTWRMRWDEDGFKFWRDYVDGAKPYFSVPPKPIPVHGNVTDLRWPFNNPGYWLSPMFTLAVGGVGAGDPAVGNFPGGHARRLDTRLVDGYFAALMT